MSAQFRFLDVVKPFQPYLPEIAAPERKVPFNQKVLWTAVTLLVFLVMSQVPLYGIMSSDSSDPLYWMRMILASNRGTLMELGISPIVSSSMLIQLLAGAQLIDVNFDLKSDRELHQTAQKLLAIVISLGQATVYVMSGLYGQPKNLGVAVCVLLVAQLVSAGLIVILLDELLQKGYGLGSGISLFIATNICEEILTKAFSPTTINYGRGTEFEGAVVNFFYSLFVGKNKVKSLIHAFTRTSAPNMTSVLMTLLVFAVVIYLQGFRVELKIQSVKQRGQYASYPIKLFYTSNMSIMLVSALTSNLFLVSQMLYSRFSNNFFIKLIGSWAPIPGSSQLRADGGLAYYMTPPLNLTAALLDPIHTAIYVMFMLGSCAAFSAIWIEVSGGSAKEVAKALKNQGMVLAGYRDASMYKELKRIIPTAAWLSGACIGFLAVSSDLLGALGSGTAVLLCTTIIYGYYEQFIQESNSQMATLGDLLM